MRPGESPPEAADATVEYQGARRPRRERQVMSPPLPSSIRTRPRARAGRGRLRRHPGGQGNRPARRQGRARLPDRHQRRRQDHDAQGHHGLQPVKSGTIRYAGEDVTGRRSFELVRKGLAMVPEGRGVFGALTIEENLAMGAYVAQRQDGDHARRRARVRASFRASRSAGGRPPERCRAASSRCWRWRAR